MHRYSIVIFIGAFLLFQVQPLIARNILPWFGGTASVWNTCMMFFQVTLLLGYLYTHALRSLLSPRVSWMVHSGVLILAVFSLPVTPAETLRPTNYDSLAAEIVKVLFWSIGLPFFVLSTTGPLIQAWHSVSHGDDRERKSSSTYRLYALSNVGSLLALLSYPLIIEPNLALNYQSTIWSVIFVIFVGTCVYSGAQVRRIGSWNKLPDDDNGFSTQEQKLQRKAGVGRIAMWIILSMVPSVMLLATTNLLCQEIASVPFLWIMPLSLYLISFIICFDKPALYHRGFFLPLLFVGCVAGIAAATLNANASALLQILLLATAMFATGMTCHGELERLKPDTSQLTLFYLFVSLGGSLGGVFVVLVAPHLFVGFPEFQLAITAAIVCGVAIPCAESQFSKSRKLTIGFCGVVIGGIVVAGLIDSLTQSGRDGVLANGRNEYGIYKVTQSDNRRIFISGHIDHGSQFFDPDPVLTPHGYYDLGSGFDVSLKALRERRLDSGSDSGGLKVGVLGLGIGSMLGWAEQDDQFTFYEINPKVEEVARQWFTFLDAFKDQVEVVIGDGRLMLESELEQRESRQFDLLTIDAFSSDSIPVHLLTDECIGVYESHLKEDGILLFHVTNRFINLKPVLFAAAAKRNLSATYIQSTYARGDDVNNSTEWVLISNRSIASEERIVSAASPYTPPKDVAAWTDDFASIFPLVEWKLEIAINRIVKNIRAQDQKK